MKRKGILGGTFDPIHNGHLHIAYEAMYTLDLDKIVFIPTGNPPHKDSKDISEAKIRYNMVKEVIDEENKFEISDYEIKKKNRSYTYETIEYLKEKEKETEWFFISGADCLMEIETWVNVEYILKNCSFVVFNRAGYEKEQLLSQRSKIANKYDCEIKFLDLPLIEVSSTFVRNKIKHRENVSYLIPNKLENSIKELRLYY
ncbi:nicotinate-nucleotide adenylyltransferase [Clostridium sp. DL1XJH146]